MHNHYQFHNNWKARILRPLLNSLVSIALSFPANSGQPFQYPDLLDLDLVA